MAAVLAPDTAAATGLDPVADLLARVRVRVHKDLLPQVVDIDVKGAYPEAFLRGLGADGLFAAHVPAAMGGTGLGLDALIRGMEEVSKVCGSTGFMAWCQSALAWYLVNTDNAALRERLLPGVMRGEILGGTGLSNLMKNCAEIEELRLKAKRVDGGYVVNGVLPWVSNLNMVQNAHFVALEGTRTFACQFRNVFVPDAEVLAHPAEFAAFVKRIKPGFVTMQCGIALGIIDDCVAIMRESDETHAHVNRYLDDQADGLAAELDGARTAIYDLASRISTQAPVTVKEVLSLRAAGSELALRASNAAMLHSGAKGYLIRNPAQRRVREAIFVAIVTPALKHLRKELAALELAEAA
ncbi:MAG: acyl-CoA/acyl-ACP dehydrogenase [Rubritepida sp.]|nr:acyl-CoA/acyl-ACP dehydrogenase [Rubritepida sp.]